MAQHHKNFIGGEWVEPATGEYFENRNPARQSDLIGLWPRSGKEDVERAVEAARRGFALWRATPAPERGAVLKTVGDLLTKRKEEIARAATRPATIDGRRCSSCSWRTSPTTARSAGACAKSGEIATTRA